MKSARQVAFDALMRVIDQGAYSNLAIDAVLRGSRLESAQAAFASALFYGVLERGIGLDAALRPYVRRGLQTLDPEVRTILRMGLYQLIYMDGVPDSAAVHESVQLAVYARKSSARGLVNAILRSFVRDGKQIPLPADTLERAGVEYSCPLWMLRQLERSYGREHAVLYAGAGVGRPPLFARVNTLRITPAALTEALAESGVQARPSGVLDDCLLLSETGSIGAQREYQAGLYHIQDLSSQLCVAALSPRPGERMVDVCAAPGSKSFTAAQYMRGQGEIRAYDLYPQKAGLIASGAERLGISCIRAGVRDAQLPPEDDMRSWADRVLCDVPCSGWGVVRRKPEIRYKPEESLRGLPELQGRILQSASEYVRPGGRLVYSTCTLRPEENERVVERFLLQNSWFHPLQLPDGFGKINKIGKNSLEGACRTVWPSAEGGDGFFFAVLERAEESAAAK